MYTITCRQSFCSSREETPSQYDPGKKTSKRKRTSDVKTSDPKPSTSQDKSASEQQPQDEPIPEQPQDEPIPQQQQDAPATKQDKASDTAMMTYQIMAWLSKFFQQKIPVPYRRNRDTVYVQKLNRFNQFCLISLYRSKRNTSTFKKLHIISKCAKIFFDYQ